MHNAQQPLQSEDNKESSKQVDEPANANPSTPTRPITTPSIPEPIIQKRCEALELFFPIIKTSHDHDDRIPEFLDMFLSPSVIPSRWIRTWRYASKMNSKKQRRRRARDYRLVEKDSKGGILARITCR